MRTITIALLSLSLLGCISMPKSSSVKFRSLESGKAVEDCFALGKGQGFIYFFESNHEVDFNIYYKTDHQYVFTVDAPKAKHVRGRFKAPRQNNYCLMWTNDQESAAEVTWTLLSDA
ncbi:MAG: hypothetical protein AAF438_11965 [Pseudomonadota bacterium]